MKKTVLITGASGGLGLELAHIFAKDGYNLVLTARSEGKLKKLKDELESKYSVSAEVCITDLSKPGAAAQVFEFTQQRSIRIDVLVNNAGFGDFGSFCNSDISVQTDMINVNVTALTELCHMFLKPMVERGDGKILNMASIAAFQPGPLMSVYYATKAFVLSFSEALSVELKGTGVSVTAVCPGPTLTGFEDAAQLAESGLFKNLRPAAAKDVAEFGYRSLMKSKLIAIHGLANRIIIGASKLAPRGLVRRVVYMIQK